MVIEDEEPAAAPERESGARIEPVERFFTQYEGFIYSPQANPAQEFSRLCRHMGWERDDPDREAAWQQYTSAMAMQFEERYGRELDDLSGLQRLCLRIGVEPIPEELEEAKEVSTLHSSQTAGGSWITRQVVYNTHVNIVDLTIAGDDEKIAIFPNELELSRYTLARRKTFPRSEAMGTLLVWLLRRIEYPPPVGSRRDTNGRVIHADGRVIRPTARRRY